MTKNDNIDKKIAALYYKKLRLLVEEIADYEITEINVVRVPETEFLAVDAQIDFTVKAVRSNR